MNKQEFAKYLKLLGELFPGAKIPGVNVEADNEILDIWYDGFKEISLADAKKMAKDYFKQEKGVFNYARLLEYKPIPRKAITNFDEE
ncbi:hypothetical protein [uncultured Clostridium sp.]|uniref:hypothetical protein n=1 Tax=uncultured Clostridium sp. TaxID=59620 RepID=UPI0025CF359F|nr:hypothetical protein [uncultured Clostridium sp.]